MSRELTVNNKTFNYPTPGESPGWGEDASDWAAEITTAIAVAAYALDIPVQTYNSIANNQTSASSITKLVFDSTLVRGAEIQYTVTRSGTVSGSPVSKVEEGRMHIVFNGSSWEVSRTYVGEAGMDFTVAPSGQVQYTSDDISAGAGVTSYTGVMKFKATSLPQ